MVDGCTEIVLKGQLVKHQKETKVIFQNALAKPISWTIQTDDGIKMF